MRLVHAMARAMAIGDFSVIRAKVILIYTLRVVTGEYFDSSSHRISILISVQNLTTQ